MKKIVAVLLVTNLFLVFIASFMCGRINYLEKYNLSLQACNNTQQTVIRACEKEFISAYGYDWVGVNYSDIVER